ncbi:Protein of unknown function [Cotesia congregata]|uniref:Uncharacterized protein n=1 Tax=Cotesia congregata TaxID=51543 RepID=A0A8J2HMR1_COTCN|nr:Protein of unknown function [Cotesia congregata]
MDTQTIEKDRKYFISQPRANLNIVGKYFESINSPRYSNLGTTTKILGDSAAEDVKNRISYRRQHNLTHTTFNINNPAHYSVQN